jgi:hypothetical protein
MRGCPVLSLGDGLLWRRAEGGSNDNGIVCGCERRVVEWASGGGAAAKLGGRRDTKGLGLAPRGTNAVVGRVSGGRVHGGIWRGIRWWARAW